MKEGTKEDEINRKQEANEEKKWVPLCQRKSLNVFRIFLICANQISINLIWAPLGILTVPMCRKLGLSHVATSTIVLFGPILGFLIPPIISALSNSTTLKMGRRRIYLIIGETLVIVGLLMIAFCREISSNKYSTFYFVTGEFLTLTGANIANVPGRAMCAEVVPPTQKILASSIMALDFAIASFVSNSIGAFKLFKYTRLSNEAFVFTVSCVFGVIAMTASVLSTHEEALLVKPKSSNPVTVLIETLRLVDRNIFFILLTNFFYSFGYTQFAGQGANYVAGTIFGGVPNAPDGLYDAGISYYQYLMLFQTCSQLFFSFVNARILKIIGFRAAWTVAMLFQCASNVLLFVVKSKTLLVLPYILSGFSIVMFNSVPMSYVSLNAPKGKTAGFITLLILNNNASAMMANFVLRMCLGSLQFFAENPGRLIALGSVFSILSLLSAQIGYGLKMKKKDE